MKALFTLFAFALSAHAQMVTVSGSSVANSQGTPITGTIYFQPTAANGTPIGYQLLNGGQITLQPVSTPITAGAFSMRIVDTTETQPANVCYRVWATNPQGATIFGSSTGGPSGYNCVQVAPSWCTGTACNFDTYSPNYAPIALSQAGPVGPVGPAGPSVPKASFGNGVCGFGDSIIGAGSTDVYWAPTFFNVLMVLSNGRMQFVHQGGVSGNTTTQMLARLSADVLTQSCSKVIMDGGTNDISAATAMATVQGNLLSMYTQIIANGQLPILVTIPPHTGVFYQQTAALNAWIRGKAAALNVPLIDVFALMADPSTGDYKSGYSTDGLHPAGAALRIIAAAALADLSNLFPAHHPLSPVSNTDANNLLSNGMLLNSASGIATGWTALNSSGHVTYSVSTDSNVAGNVQVFTKSTTASGDNDALAAPDIASGYSAGDRIAFTGKLVTSGLEAGIGSVPPSVNVYFYTSAFAYAGNFLAPWTLWPCDIAAGQMYIEAVVPAGTAHIAVQVNVGNGTGVFKLGQLGVYDLTALGL